MTRVVAVNASRRVFVFHGHERAWHPWKGLRTPPGELYVLHSIPGKYVASGKSLADAVRRLAAVLTSAMGHGEQGSDAWWSEALGKMNDVDTALYFDTLRNVLANGVQDAGTFSFTVKVEKTAEPEKCSV